ncbi:Rho guanyl-nucleotide exchange factor, partial [Tyrophagus putrescentiae]
GDQRAYHRPRRGAMVSCENLLSESSELFGGVPENSGQHNLLSSSLKSSSNKSAAGGSNSSSSRKMYRSGGGIFSNPFKSDSEKMDLLTDLLKQYRESGIPETGGGGKHHHHLLHSQSHCQSTNKLNHLRASSLSIGGFTGSRLAHLSRANLSGNSNSSSANNSPSSSLLLAASSSSSSTHQKVTSLSTTDLHHLHHSLSLTGSPQSSAGQHHQQQQTSSSFDASDDAGSSYLYLEPEWGSIVEGAEQLPGRVKAQNEAIWELLTTEVFYIRRLKVVNDIFVACLLNLQSECILSEIDAKNVFSNIGQVFEANHHFWMNHLLPMLNYSRETKSPLNPAMFEEGFLQFDQIFQPYIQYCLEQSTCLQYIKEKKKTNVLFKTYVLWCENHKDCERLRLIDLLVMPWQRLTKYSLLIKAILKKTDNEMHREALKRMDLCVDRFVTNVNGAMFRQQEHERLSTVVSRIDSYDAIDCNHDEAEKLIKDYLYLDLLQGMPGCSSSQIRHLYLEDSLKLKDAQSNKVDVHCFLFTDVFLVCKSLSKKASGSECKVKVVRQPFVTDRLVVRELKDGSGFLMIYLNELQVASAFLLLYTADTRTWVEGIRRAQEDYRNLKYSSEQEASMYLSGGGGGGGGGGYQTHSYDQDDAGSSFDAGSTTSGLIMGGSGGGGGRLHHLGAGGGGGGGGGGISPRSSSRSSLVHSHSGSQEMAIANDQQQQQQLVVGSAPTTHQSYISSGNQLTINQAGSGGQPPRAVSFELGDLRNPSLVVEDADAFARSQSVETRSPVAVTITSPRPERRAFLLMRSTGGGSGSGGSGGNGSGSSGGGNEGNGGTGNQRNSSGNSSPLNGSVTYLSQNSLSPHPMPRSGRRSAIAAAAAAAAASAAAAANNSSSAEAPNYHPQSQPQPQQHLSSIQVAVTAPPPSPPPPPTSSSSPQKRQSPPPSGQVIVSRSSPTSSSSTTTTPTPPPPPPPPPSPPSLMSISSRGQPNSPLTMTINKPPLVKTKNVSCGVASLTSYPGTGPQQQQQEQQVQCESVMIEGGEGGGEHQQHYQQHHHPRPPSRSFEHQAGDSQTDEGGSGSSEEYLKNSCKYGQQQQQQQQPKRTCRPDHRDSALPNSPAMCFHAKTDSQCSVDSTASCGGDAGHHRESLVRSGSGVLQTSTSPPSITSVNTSDIKIDVSEVKDGISSVQITLGSGSGGSGSASPTAATSSSSSSSNPVVTRPSKADLKKMKEFLLSNCNVESSEV